MARSAGRVWIAAAVVVVVVAVGIATTLALKLPGWLEGPSDVEETSGQRKEKVREAFASASSTAPSSDQRSNEIDRFFTQLGAAYRSGDGDRIAGHYDYLAMLKLADKRKLLPPISELKLRSLADKLHGAQAKQLTETAKYIAWERHRVVKITYLDEEQRDEVVVYVRQISKLTGIGKQRWWLLRQDDRWRVYDSEDLSLGLRMSAMLGAGMSAAHNKESWGERFIDVMTAAQAIGDGRFADLGVALEKLRGVEFPPQLQALVHMLDATYQIFVDDFDAALKLCDRARQANPDMVTATYLRMTALNLKEDYTGALASGKEYIDALGPDADVALEFAIAYRGLGKLPQAAEQVQSCLDELPDHTDCIRILAAVIAPERVAVLDGRLRKLEDLDTTMATTLDESLEYQDGDAAKVLLAAIKRLKPSSPLILEYTARVNALTAP